jgi:hypothetical protein
MLCLKNIKGETFATGSRISPRDAAARIFMTNYSTGRTTARKDARL